MTTTPDAQPQAAPAFPATSQRIWSVKLTPNRATAITLGTDASTATAAWPGSAPRVYVAHTPPTQTGPTVTRFFTPVRTGAPVPPGAFIGTAARSGVVVHVYEVSAPIAVAINAAADAAEAASLGLDPTAFTGGGDEDASED